MKTLLTTTFCLTLIINSFCQSNTTQNHLKAVQLLTESYLGKDTTNIFFYSDLVLYQKNAYSYFNNDTTELISSYDSIDKTTGDTITISNMVSSFSIDDSDSVVINKKYFIHHKDSSYGFIYDTAMIDNIRRVTIYEGRGFTFFSTDTSFVSVKPDSSIWNDDMTELKQVYIEPAKIDTPATTIIFYFRKNMNLPLTISDILSKDRKMTFYRTQIKFGEFFDKRVNQLLPPHTAMEFELREFFPKDTKEIMKYFEWYKVEVEKNK